MRRLALDISGSSGWATLDDAESPGNPKIADYGLVKLAETVRDYGGFLYPWTYVLACERVAEGLLAVVEAQRPDELVIEETNGGGRGSRYSQKILEMIHAYTLVRIREKFPNLPVLYVDTSEWRRVLGIRVDDEHRRLNAKLSRHKKKHELYGTKLDRKALGITGRYTIKHATVAWVNAHFGLELKIKDDDLADALAICLASFRGARFCDGT